MNSRNLISAVAAVAVIAFATTGRPLAAQADSLREIFVRRDSDRPGSEAVLSKVQGLYGQIDRSTHPPTDERIRRLLAI